MIRHVVNRDQLLPLRRYDSGDVLLQFVVVNGIDEVLPALHGEHDLNVDLRVGVSHYLFSCDEAQDLCRPYGPCQRFLFPVSTNMPGLTALG